MKYTKNGMTKEVAKDRVDYYENKGWRLIESESVILKPAKKNTVETPAVESVVDSEEVDIDELKGD